MTMVQEDFNYEQRKREWEYLTKGTNIDFSNILKKEEDKLNEKY